MDDPISKLRPSDINFSSEDFEYALEIVQKDEETKGLEGDIKSIVTYIRFLARKYSISLTHFDLVNKILEDMSKEDSFNYQNIAEEVRNLIEESEPDSGSVEIPKTGNVIYKGFSYSLLYDHVDSFPLENGGYPAVEITKENAKLSYVITDWKGDGSDPNFLSHVEHDDDLMTILAIDSSAPISNKIFDTINALVEENDKVERIQLCICAGMVPDYKIYLKDSKKHEHLSISFYDESRFAKGRYHDGEEAVKNDYVYEDYVCAELTKELKKYLSSEPDGKHQEIRKLLLTPIGSLDHDLSTRTRSCLNAGGIDTLADLVTLQGEEMLGWRNFGKKSFKELNEFLKEKNLTWETDISKYGLGEEMRKLLLTPLSDLDLSDDTLNHLKKSKFKILAHLVALKGDYVWRIFDEKTLPELHKLLMSKRLRWGMDVTRYGLVEN